MTWWPALDAVLFSAIGFLCARLFDRYKAQEAEIGRLHGRMEMLDAIVTETKATATANESGRLDAREIKLDLILRELSAVTEAQKGIEVKLTGGEWDRQTVWRERLTLYTRLLHLVDDMREHVNVMKRFPPGSTDIPHDEVAAIYNTRTSQEKELVRILPFIQIFGDRDLTDAVRVYRETSTAAKFTRHSDFGAAIEQEHNALIRLWAECTAIARRQLNAGHTEVAMDRVNKTLGSDILRT